MIDKLTVKRIEETARIEEVVADFVRLRKTGVRYTGICPFHDDRHDGNFIVYPKKNCFKCFTCDAKGGSIKFLMMKGMDYVEALRYLARKYNILIDMDRETKKNRKVPILSLPWEMVYNRQRTENDALCYWIRHCINWNDEQRARIEKVLNDYYVGHTTVRGTNEFTIFWQIDDNHIVRTAHMMKYREDGHRMKDDRYNTDWVHSLLTRKKNQSDPWPFPGYYNPDKEEHETCLFGLHLLNEYPGAPVCIVESEKTALLMAISQGNNSDHVWMACSGMGNITRGRLSPLIRQDRMIALFPDKDGIDKWKEQCKMLNYQFARVAVEEIEMHWKPEDGPKADIGDIEIRMIGMTAVHTITENLSLEIAK